ncbi:MAG TPA: YidB family protein [Rhodopila sp.]|jgi:uncharacterized protein YidB (DUF937 family)|nr:YidB family protein [Rhodopila sp.]
MALLDSVLGGLLGGHPQASPLQSVLGSILGGGGGGYGGQGGGLPGLIEAFRGAGMGNTVNSWVGTGANQPVSPNQLQQVFGQEQVNQWSQQTGMPQQTLLQELSNLLPHAVDRMTPNGQVPSSPFDAPGLELPQR